MEGTTVSRDYLDGTTVVVNAESAGWAATELKRAEDVLFPRESELSEEDAKKLETADIALGIAAENVSYQYIAEFAQRKLDEQGVNTCNTKEAK